MKKLSKNETITLVEIYFISLGKENPMRLLQGWLLDLDEMKFQWSKQREEASAMKFQRWEDNA